MIRAHACYKLYHLTLIALPHYLKKNNIALNIVISYALLQYSTGINSKSITQKN